LTVIRKQTGASTANRSRSPSRCTVTSWEHARVARVRAAEPLADLESRAPLPSRGDEIADRSTVSRWERHFERFEISPGSPDPENARVDILT